MGAQTHIRYENVEGSGRGLFYNVYNLLHNLYSSPDIFRQIKSRRMSWAGHVARMGEGRNVYRVLVGKPEGKNHLEEQDVDGWMGSKWILGRLVGGVWTGFTWLRIGTVGGLL
jgi:hypothetical protein